MSPSAETNGWGHGDESAIFVPVLIVGGGPTGLLMGHMLAQLGGLWSKARTSVLGGG
jgi:NADPH-dependent 2,4-dienoyl-CoA reductase/sulfur reductase-like enzyme